MTKKILARGQFPLFRRPCKKCSSMFQPQGRFCYICPKCTTSTQISRIRNAERTKKLIRDREKLQSRRTKKSNP